MSSYSYVAVDPRGTETRGTIDVSTQMEAIRRIREMGLFPIKILAEAQAALTRPSSEKARSRWSLRPSSRGLAHRVSRLGGRVPSSTLSVFTRQTATLIEAGMPLLRGLRTLNEQEENRAMRSIIADLSEAIEGGATYAEALGRHPKIFNQLYINMVKAGELSGALDITLKRLAEFMEKAQAIKGKVKAALLYPCAVLLVATVILVLLMTFVVPRFQDVFNGLLEGRAMPGFTLLVLKICQVVKMHFFAAASAVLGSGVLFWLAVRSGPGRLLFDNLKLRIPALGPVFRKLAIARLARTLGTLMASGVPILQALTIIQKTTGNVVVGNVVARLHAAVKEGEAIAPTLRASSVFPPMVAGMVDVGEQTGALPEMLMKVADTYDEQVDNATNAMTSLLEPILIVFLAIVVGSIVIAMFLPLIWVIRDLSGGSGEPQ